MTRWRRADKLWYLAYGSNMSSAKFTGGRGIVPLDTARIRVPGWVLVMEIPGLPYSEPSFSSIRPRADSDAEKLVDPDVIGVAYLITAEQYGKVIASEGGGIAYDDIAVRGEPVMETERVRLGNAVMVRTLGTAMVRRPCPRPSHRYMRILVEGAEEAMLPPDYQQYLAGVPTYEPPQGWWSKIGASIFISLWGPVMAAMEKITNANMKQDGYTQHWVIWFVRLTMTVIWATHDWIFAPIFGQGDGLTSEREDEKEEGLTWVMQEK